MMLDGGISKNYLLNEDHEDPTILVKNQQNVGSGAITPQIFTNFEQQIQNDKNLKALHDTMQNLDDDANESYNGNMSSSIQFNDQAIEEPVPNN